MHWKAKWHGATDKHNFTVNILWLINSRRKPQLTIG
jgi:hypothetical protein